MYSKLSKAIIIETILLIICLFCVLFDYFSNHNIFDLFININKSENLLIEQLSPDSSSKVCIYQIEPSSLSSLSIRVDFISNKDSKIYSYFTSVRAEDMPVNNQYYYIQWKNNHPYIYLSGNPIISIDYIE